MSPRCFRGQYERRSFSTAEIRRPMLSAHASNSFSVPALMVLPGSGSFLFCWINSGRFTYARYRDAFMWRISLQIRHKWRFRGACLSSACSGVAETQNRGKVLLKGVGLKRPIDFICPQRVVVNVCETQYWMRENEQSRTLILVIMFNMRSLFTTLDIQTLKAYFFVKMVKYNMNRFNSCVLLSICYYLYIVLLGGNLSTKLLESGKIFKKVDKLFLSVI